MRSPKDPTGTLRQAASADAMGNHLDTRVEAPLIHLIHIAPGLRRGIVLKVGTLEIGPHLRPAARTLIAFGSAQILIAKTLISSSPTSV